MLEPIDKRISDKTVVTDSGCHEWTGRKRKGGYGVVQHEGVTYSLHRFAYARAHGPIPDGLHVLHTCDNPSCFNVAHLRLGTHKENMHDKMSKGRQLMRNGQMAAPWINGAPPPKIRTTDKRKAIETKERKPRVRPDTPHGTDALYRRGCRCDLCREYKRRIRKR